MNNMKDSKAMFNYYTNKVNPELTKDLKGAECEDHQDYRSNELSDWFGVAIWFIASAVITAAFIFSVVKGWIG